MYSIEYGSKFRKAYDKITISGGVDAVFFQEVISLLARGKMLSDRCRDHALKGDFSGLRECHIKGDCLLLYRVYEDRKVIRLIDAGNHANLFK